MWVNKGAQCFELDFLPAEIRSQVTKHRSVLGVHIHQACLHLRPGPFQHCTLLNCKDESRQKRKNNWSGMQGGNKREIEHGDD